MGWKRPPLLRSRWPHSSEPKLSSPPRYTESTSSAHFGCPNLLFPLWNSSRVLYDVTPFIRVFSAPIDANTLGRSIKTNHRPEDPPQPLTHRKRPTWRIHCHKMKVNQRPTCVVGDGLVMGLDDEREGTLSHTKHDHDQVDSRRRRATVIKEMQQQLTGQENSNGSRTVYPLLALALLALPASKTTLSAPRTGVTKLP